MSDYTVWNNDTRWDGFAWIPDARPEYCAAPGCVHVPTTGPRREQDELTPRFAVHGTDLCNWHHAQFPRVLGDLVNLVSQIEHAAYTKARTGGDASGIRGASGGTPADAGTSWNPHAAAVLAEVKDWTRYLVHILTLEYPGTVGLTEDDNVRAQLRTIATWYSSWLSRYPRVGPALLNDALQHRRVGVRALQAEPVRRFTLGTATCQHLIEDDARLGPILCGAPLYAIIRPKDDGRPSAILCSTNPNHPQLARENWVDALPRPA